MDRREYLSRTAAALGAGVLAGCLGSNAPGSGMSGDGSVNTTAAGTTAGEPTLVGRSFEMTDSGCGNETNEATVSFGERVLVTGTITGTDECQTAVLRDAGYSDGELAVVVGTEDEEGAGACAECLVEIEYEASFTFEGGAPESVTVEHESLGERRTVATASP